MQTHKQIFSRYNKFFIPTGKTMGIPTQPFDFSCRWLEMFCPNMDVTFLTHATKTEQRKTLGIETWKFWGKLEIPDGKLYILLDKWEWDVQMQNRTPLSPRTLFPSCIGLWIDCNSPQSFAHLSLLLVVMTRMVIGSFKRCFLMTRVFTIARVCYFLLISCFICVLLYLCIDSCFSIQRLILCVFYVCFY